MKQNERLLVYAVTCFLALILVIAVMFGNDPVDASEKQENSSKGLSDILNGKMSEAELAKKLAADAVAKTLAEKLMEDQVEQPLNAKPLRASEVVARELGPSRRDRFARWVPVKKDDGFERLVRRWCGEPEDYLDEAVALNEETTRLVVGREVMVPWVDDEVLAAIIAARTVEARGPRALMSNPAGSDPNRTLMNSSPGVIEPGMPRPSVTRPGFAIPGRGPSGAASSGGNSEGRNSEGSSGNGASAGRAVTYKVKSGDNLWKISAKRYGERKADAMVKVILGMNPGLSAKLNPGQEFQMPAKAE